MKIPCLFLSAYGKISLFLCESLVCFLDLVKEEFSPSYGTYSGKTIKIPANKIQVPSLTFCCYYRVGQNKVSFELGDFEKGKRSWSPFKGCNSLLWFFTSILLEVKIRFFLDIVTIMYLGNLLNSLTTKCKYCFYLKYGFQLCKKFDKELVKSLETKCKSLIVLEQKKFENQTKIATHMDL
jgi:hypothetical protein